MKKIFIAIVLFALFPTVIAADITVFVSPDSAYQEFKKFVSDADELKIATYTFTNPDIAKILLDNINKRGMNLTLLIEKSPAGGRPEIENKILCNLNEKADIFLISKFDFMHAKYAIKNNRTVLISTENLVFQKNNQGNRGWFAIIDNINTTKIEDIFNYDINGSQRFACALSDYQLLTTAESGTYKNIFQSEKFTGDVRFIFAPDAVNDVINLIKSAKKSILIEQLYIYRNWGTTKNPTDNLFLNAVIEQARNNVTVKILLDSYYYDIEKNQQTIDYINDINIKENLSIEAKFIDLNKLGISLLHAKGVIIDNGTENEKVFISSINWNENSPRDNREAGVIITGKSADYFAKVFDYDWNPTSAITGLAISENSFFIAGIIVIFILIIIIIFIIAVARRPPNSLGG